MKPEPTDKDIALIVHNLHRNKPGWELADFAREIEAALSAQSATLTDEKIVEWMETIGTYDISGYKLHGRDQIIRFARALLAAQPSNQPLSVHADTALAKGADAERVTDWVLDESKLRARIKEMQEAAYTYGDYSKEAVCVALDGVLDEIDELSVATPTDMIAAAPQAVTGAHDASDVRDAALEEAVSACGRVGANETSDCESVFQCIDATRAIKSASQVGTPCANEGRTNEQSAVDVGNFGDSSAEQMARYISTLPLPIHVFGCQGAHQQPVARIIGGEVAPGKCLVEILSDSMPALKTPLYAAPLPEDSKRDAALEEVAALLDAEADKQEAAWNAFLASGRPGPATTFHNIPRKYAEQVRAMKSAAIREANQ
jgi:hypothetical protein